MRERLSYADVVEGCLAHVDGESAHANRIVVVDLALLNQPALNLREAVPNSCTQKVAFTGAKESRSPRLNISTASFWSRTTISRISSKLFTPMFRRMFSAQ